MNNHNHNNRHSHQNQSLVEYGNSDDENEDYEISSASSKKRKLEDKNRIFSDTKSSPKYENDEEDGKPHKSRSRANSRLSNGSSPLLPPPSFLVISPSPIVVHSSLSTHNQGLINSQPIKSNNGKPHNNTNNNEQLKSSPFNSDASEIEDYDYDDSDDQKTQKQPNIQSLITLPSALPSDPAFNYSNVEQSIFISPNIQRLSNPDLPSFNVESSNIDSAADLEVNSTSPYVFKDTRTPLLSSSLSSQISSRASSSIEGMKGGSSAHSISRHKSRWERKEETNLNHLKNSIEGEMLTEEKFNRKDLLEKLEEIKVPIEKIELDKESLNNLQV